MIPSKPFYFIRHGQTDANAKGLTCGGDWDISLNEVGLLQAQKAASDIFRLGISFGGVYVSPMLRAKQTADVINAQLSQPLVIVEELREWRVGDWEYKPWGEVPNPFNTTEEPPGGELREVFERRVAGAVASIVLDSLKSPLIVAHGAVGHALFTVLGADVGFIENATLYSIEPKDRHWVVSKVEASV